MKCLIACLSLISLVSMAAEQAQTQTREPTPLPSVEVRAQLADRAQKPYSEMLRAMDAFDEYQRKNPDTELRFRLYSRRKDMDARRIRLNLVTASRSVPIELAPDLSFTLPRISDMAVQHAMLQANVKVGDLGWRAQVSRRGDPPNLFRLGDLRLACKLHFLTTNLARTGGTKVLPGSDKPSFCGESAVNNFSERSLFAMHLSPSEGVAHSIADGPMFAIHLSHGQRRMSLLSNRLNGNALPQAVQPLLDWPLIPERVYFPPIADTRWPDDTLVRIEYLEGDGTANTPLPTALANKLQMGRSRRSELQQLMGTPTIQRFDNGYEVWTYRQLNGVPGWVNYVPFVGAFMPNMDDRSFEHAFLFGADGVLRKYDLRGGLGDVRQALEWASGLK